MLRVFLATAVGLGYKVRPYEEVAGAGGPGAPDAPALDLEEPPSRYSDPGVLR